MKGSRPGPLHGLEPRQTRRQADSLRAKAKVLASARYRLPNPGMKLGPRSYPEAFAAEGSDCFTNSRFGYLYG